MNITRTAAPFAALCTILLLCLASQSFALSGPVSGIWHAQSPIIIDGDTNVLAGTTLTIEPGAIILFTGRFSLTITGTLLALGSSEQPIIFSRAQQTEESKWRGIRFINADNASLLEYCIIRFARGDGDYPGVRGGAVYIENCSPTIRFSDINNNYSHNTSFNGSGGAIYIHANSSSLIEFNHLHANESDSGGAINVSGIDSLPIIRNNVIEGNLAHSSGGGIYLAANSDALIHNNVIRTNTAGYWGGGGISLWNNGCSTGNCTKIYNNLIYQNSAVQENGSGFGNGGGIYCRYNISSQFNNTIYANSAEGKGGGIYVLNQGNMTPTMSNSIIWNNTAPTGPQISLEEITSDTGEILYLSVADVAYSIVQGGWEGTGNIGNRPHFANPASGNFQLMPESPGIDAGNNSVTGLPSFDFTGGTRIIDGDLNGSDLVDIGALEFDPMAPLPGDIDRNASINLADTILILQLLCGKDIGQTGNLTDIDVNDDGVIGLVEAVFTIQHVAEP